MGKSKMKTKQKPSKFLPPTVAPVGKPDTAAEMQRIRKSLNEQRDNDNRVMSNIIFGTAMIVLKEFYNFTVEQLEDFIDRAHEQIELIGKELVTEDQVMELIKSYGLNVVVESGLEAQADIMTNKLKVYAALENGTTEIQDLAKATGVSSKLCSAIRWMWNKEKYGKDYIGDEIMATKQSMAYELFDQGYKNKDVEKLTSSAQASVWTWRNQWKKDRMSKLSTDGAASILAGEKDLLTALKDEGIIEVMTTEQPKEEAKSGIVEQPGEVKSDIMEETKSAPIQTEATREAIKPKKAEPRAVSNGMFKKKVTLEGQYATYKREDDYVDVEIGGLVVVLKLEELAALGNEMIAASKEV